MAALRRKMRRSPIRCSSSSIPQYSTRRSTSPKPIRTPLSTRRNSRASVSGHDAGIARALELGAELLGAFARRHRDLDVLHDRTLAREPLAHDQRFAATQHRRVLFAHALEGGERFALRPIAGKLDAP